MSKLFPGIISTVVATVIIAISPVQAQLAPPGSAPTTTPSIAKPLPPAIATPTTAPTKQELKLLSKAAGIFWQTDRSETESTMLLYGKQSGLTIDSTIQVKTIAQTGGKFRSQLTFTPLGSTVKITYTIVSNGRNVWIHRLDRNEYAKTTFAISDRDHVWIGISSFMFLTLDQENRKSLIASLGTDQDLILNLKPPNPQDLQWANRQVDGMNLAVYSANVEKFKVDTFLNLETANLHKIEFTGQESGLDIKFSETIVKRSSQVNITDQTFKFTPPKGAKKVKSIKIKL